MSQIASRTPVREPMCTDSVSSAVATVASDVEVVDIAVGHQTVAHGCTYIEYLYTPPPSILRAIGPKVAFNRSFYKVPQVPHQVYLLCAIVKGSIETL
jgi:hypothetical protein